MVNEKIPLDLVLKANLSGLSDKYAYKQYVTIIIEDLLGLPRILRISQMDR